MQKRSGLGRGLGALIPTESAEQRDATLREIAVSAIAANRFQPREHFDEEALAALTASVRELGVLQPILVRQLADDRYELIAGERRWRAAKRAGLDTIPALVRAIDDRQSLEQALVENLHRKDLNALEEAAGYTQLMDEFKLTQEEVAQRVGKSRSAVANMLRLFHLPPAVQRLVAEGRLSAGHARAILGTPDRLVQEQLAEQCIQEGWSVRDIEAAVRERAPTATQDDIGATEREEPSLADDSAEIDSSAAPGVRPLREPALLELEELLSARLDTRVNVSIGSRRGRIMIDFADLDDLERIYRIITPPGATVGE